MTTFQTNRTNIKGYILKQVLACMAIFIILGIYEYYISTKPSNWIFYLTMACLTIIQLIVELFKKRLFSIAFDLQKKQIFFLYKDFFYREKIKIIPFETTQIEVDDDTSIFRWFKKSMTLYFLKNKVEICSVRSSYDGFSYGQLEKICELVKTIVQKDN